MRKFCALLLPPQQIFFPVSCLALWKNVFIFACTKKIAGTASHRAWHRVTLKRQENESYSFERDRTGLS